LEPWSHEWDTTDADGNVVSLPESLRREAERSVLKGWALPSEADASRRRAAEALLARGPAGLRVKAPLTDARRRLARTGFARPVVPKPPPPRTPPPPQLPPAPDGPPRPPATPPRRPGPPPGPAGPSPFQPTRPRVGGPGWEGVNPRTEGTVTAAEYEDMVAQALGHADRPAPVYSARRSVDGRTALARTLADLTERYPLVSHRITDGIQDKGRRRAEAWARAPRWSDGRQTPDELRGGAFAFGGTTYAAKLESATERWNERPQRRRISAGGQWLTVEGLHNVPTDDVQVGVVAHEYGHQVGYLAEEQALINRAADEGVSMDAMRGARLTAEGTMRTQLKDVVRTEVEAGRVPRLEDRVMLSDRQQSIVLEAHGEEGSMGPEAFATYQAGKDPGEQWLGYVARDVSFYGATNEQEAMAEAFMDVYMNGPDAAPLSQAIVDRMNELVDQAEQEATT
jgi:hypothetical protein